MTEHPDHLAAISIAYHPSEPARSSRTGAIWALGVLSVQRTTDQSARFMVHHFTYQRDADPRRPLADLKTLTKPTSTVIGYAPRRSPHMRHYYRVLGGQSLQSRLLRGATRKPAIVIRSDQSTLITIAEAHGLVLPVNPADLLQQARAAPKHAQAISLAYLWSNCSQRERNGLSAAFRAWRAVEDARPLPFRFRSRVPSVAEGKTGI